MIHTELTIVQYHSPDFSQKHIVSLQYINMIL